MLAEAASGADRAGTGVGPIGADGGATGSPDEIETVGAKGLPGAALGTITRSGLRTAPAAISGTGSAGDSVLPWRGAGAGLATGSRGNKR
jgi:hypothetical protein